MISFGVFMDFLKLSAALGTAIPVDFCGDTYQPRRLGDRHAGAVVADCIDGEALELELRQSPEDLLKAAVKPDAGRFVIAVRGHSSHTRWVCGAPPPTLIP